MKTLDLIIPFSAPCAEKLYLLEGAPGSMPFVQGIENLKYTKWQHIVILIRQADDQTYKLSQQIMRGFSQSPLRDKVQVWCLPHDTNSQVETVVWGLQKLNISGAFWVKDPDNSFDSEVIAENVVTAFPLDALSSVNPQNKSYLSISDGDYIMNIAEKKIIGRYFCTGGYGFENAEKFIETYNLLKKFGRLYLSHIIYRQLLDGAAFRPLYVTNYVDWGTRNDWQQEKILHN